MMWAQQCPGCPQHVVTGSDAAVSYAWFCETFGFPVGPAGSRDLLLFYELWSSTGTLVQSGQASGCPVQGLHPENFLFDPDQGYLWSVLEVCEDVSYILLYCNYTPCQEPGRQCAQSLQTFLQHHSWVRLDLFFAQLYHVHPGESHCQENQAGLRTLASLWPRLSISPISGAAWSYLQQRYVYNTPASILQCAPLQGRVEADRENAVQISAITLVGPLFLDLPLMTEVEPEESSQHQTPSQPLTVLPPPHLPLPAAPTQPAAATAIAPHVPPHPVNVVRHVRMPPPRHGYHPPQASLSPSCSMSCPPSGPQTSLLPIGRPVEIVQLMEKKVSNVSQSQHTDNKKNRKSKRKK